MISALHSNHIRDDGDFGTQTSEQSSDVSYSGEDTEDASEGDGYKNEQYTEIKEQVYQEKLDNLKAQLEQLDSKNHPEYLKRLRKAQQNFEERLRQNDLTYERELQIIEEDCLQDKKSVGEEFELKKLELKDNLIQELEEKRRQVELERTAIDINTDLSDSKSTTTRKLRRRPNDPLPIVADKRRKTTPSQISFQLEDYEVDDDLKVIQKISRVSSASKRQFAQQHSLSEYFGRGVDSIVRHETQFDARIVDGRLYYDRRWFSRGQTVAVDSADMPKSFAAEITAIGESELWIRRSSSHAVAHMISGDSFASGANGDAASGRSSDANADSQKVCVSLSQLQRGSVTVRKRL